MSRYPAILFTTISLATTGVAQGTEAPKAPDLTPAQLIAAAVLPAPPELRETATVLGYDAAGNVSPIRAGGGPLICLAPNPTVEQFHVACYHRSLNAFMARGRALRQQGVTGTAVDSVRFREVRRGTLTMPRVPAVLYTITGPRGSYDPEKGTVTGARSLFVIYVSNATGASLGISEKPAEGVPWVMNPGTPKAHIMFVQRM